MSTTMRRFNELEARMDVFLDRLETRVREVGTKARDDALHMKGEGDEAQDSQSDFKSTMTRRISAVADRAETTFGERFVNFSRADGEDIRAAYENLEAKVQAWAQKTRDYAKHLFDSLDDVYAQEVWDAALAEWRSQASRFACSQCSSPVPVPELYTETVRLPCVECGTQVVFTPPSAMMSARRAAEALAEIEARDAKHVYEKGGWESVAGADGAALLEYLLIRQWALAKRVPSFAAKKAETLADEFRTEMYVKESSLAPEGYRETECGYYYMMSGFGKLATGFRREGRTEDLNLLLAILPGAARPECRFAQAILDGSYSDQLYAKFFNYAQENFPPLPGGEAF